ncbi:MAG: hypothetical protein E7608_07220 [Ruminococcaceae bacterium]|nr:hypothetical protein [Oscillospiraceae bacterium]
MDIKDKIEEKYRNLCEVKPGTTKEEYEKNQAEYFELISKLSKKERKAIMFEIIEKLAQKKEEEQKNLVYTEQNARCSEILEMIDDILSKGAFDIKENESKVVRREYSKGGECIYRGYYCPSKIEDIVVGNVKRGRLLKRVKGSNPTYCYGFDENDRIISAKKICTDEYEFIYYKGNEQIGVNFRRDAMSIAISKFENDKIISYELFHYDGYNKTIWEYQKEIYQYSDERMLVIWEFYNKFSDGIFFERTTYDFAVKDGFLSNYLADGVREYKVDPKIKREV